MLRLKYPSRFGTRRRLLFSRNVPQLFHMNDISIYILRSINLKISGVFFIVSQSCSASEIYKSSYYFSALFSYFVSDINSLSKESY